MHRIPTYFGIESSKPHRFFRAGCDILWIFSLQKLKTALNFGNAINPQLSSVYCLQRGRRGWLTAVWFDKRAF